MKKTCLLALMVLVSAAGASAADQNKGDDNKTAATADQTTTTADQKSKNDKFDPNKVICHTDQETGSRTRVNRVCHTRAEWAQLQQETEKGIRDMGRQENSGIQQTHTAFGS